MAHPSSFPQRTSAGLLAFVLGSTVAGAGTAPESAWPGFRGPRGDGSASLAVWPERPRLAESWRVPLGSGYSGVIGARGRLITAWAEGGKDWLGAFDAATGERLWRSALGDTYAGHDGSHDGPIATPAIAGERVVMVGPHGVLAAFALADGRELWRVDLAAVEGSEEPLYGFGTSPLVAGDLVVVQHAVKGSHLVAAYDLATGERRWIAGGAPGAGMPADAAAAATAEADGEAPLPDVVDYRSPILAELGGVRQVIAVTQRLLLGIDPAAGAVLWRYEHGGDGSAMAGSAVPTVLAGDRIFLAHTFDAAQLLRVTRDGESWKVDPLWQAKPLGRSYAPVVTGGELLLGFSGPVLATAAVADGARRWRSRDVADGFPLALDDHFVVLTKRGALHLGRAGAEGWQEEAKLALFDGVAWTPPSLVDGKIVARGLAELASVEVVAGPAIEGTVVAGAKPAEPASGFAAFLARLEKEPAKPAAIDAYLAQVPPGPIVEGERVHFLYRGAGEDVAITSDFIGARTQEPMRRVPGTDLFHWSTTLPDGALVSYRFVVDFEQQIPDPRNPWKLTEGRSEASWLAMPGFVRPAWLDAAAPERGGRLVQHDLANADGLATPPPAANAEAASGATPPPPGPPPPPPAKPRFDVWLPPGYETSDGRLPVAYFHDGDRALADAGYAAILDRIAAGGHAPLVVVFVHRFADYPAEGTAYTKAVADEVVPFVDRTYRTRAERTARASVGASYGGTMAMLTALRSPALFGVAAAQSPFMLTFERDALITAIPDGAQPLTVHLETATFDLRAAHEGWDIARDAATVAAALRERGHRVETREVVAGHGWGSFRTRADVVLGGLFAPAP